MCIRDRLWEARYGKGKPRKDDFVGYLMNLRYIAESGKMDPGGRKKKLAVNAILGLGLYEFTQKTENEQTVILSELENTCRKYIDISSQGRGFTSVIFGMGQLSDESIAGKIADEIKMCIRDRDKVSKLIAEAEDYLKAHFKKDYYDKVAASCAAQKEQENAEYRKVREELKKEHESSLAKLSDKQEIKDEKYVYKNRLYDAQMLHESKLQEIKDRKHEAFTHKYHLIDLLRTSKFTFTQKKIQSFENYKYTRCV